MERISILSLLVLSACASPRGQQGLSAVDLPTVRPCAGSNLQEWNDSLPIVTDTALQRVVAGGSALRYPDDLRRAYRSGVVRARFIIDTMGQVMRRSTAIEAYTDEGFVRAVCDALPRLKFAPIAIAGHKAIVGFLHVPFTFRVRS
jgi:TonB family protein